MHSRYFFYETQLYPTSTLFHRMKSVKVKTIPQKAGLFYKSYSIPHSLLSPRCLGREPTPLHIHFKPRSKSLLFFLAFCICSLQYHQGTSLSSLGKQWKQFPLHRVESEVQRDQEQSFSFISGTQSGAGSRGQELGNTSIYLQISDTSDCSDPKVIH